MDRPDHGHGARPTTLEAETLAKVALLRGTADAPGVLCHHGGVLVHADSSVEEIAAMPARRLTPRRSHCRGQATRRWVRVLTS